MATVDNWPYWQRVRAEELESSLMDIYENKCTEGTEGHVWRKTGSILLGCEGREKGESALVQLK